MLARDWAEGWRVCHSCPQNPDELPGRPPAAPVLVTRLEFPGVTIEVYGPPAVREAAARAGLVSDHARIRAELDARAAAAAERAQQAPGDADEPYSTDHRGADELDRMTAAASYLPDAAASSYIRPYSDAHTDEA